MRFILALMLLGLSSCATSYQPEGWAGGYKDMEIGKNRYLVMFRGNGYTSRSTTTEYAVRRAKEICNEKGMDFEIDQASQDTSTAAFDGGSSRCVGQGAYVNCAHSAPMTVSKASTQVTVICVERKAAGITSNEASSSSNRAP